jgi:pimeloyl-ACP methyl ester carboxylesterase
MMVVLDGTGPYNTDQYKECLTKFSFCGQLKRSQSVAKAVKEVRYDDGPGTLPINRMAWLADEIADELRAVHRQTKEKIFLAGYSRGGATAIQVAKLLNYTDRNPKTPKDRRIVAVPVQALFLFDPVTKDALLDADGIPANVARCYVMYRDIHIWEYSPKISLADYASWLDKTLAVGFNVTGKNDPDRYARKFMENSKVARDAGNQTTEIIPSDKRDDGVIDDASHGAVGGVPWLERYEDEEPTKKAAKRMNGYLEKEGIPGVLEEQAFQWAKTQPASKRPARVTQQSYIADQERLRQLRAIEMQRAQERLRELGPAGL